jgi:hypothetical protein
LGVELFIDPGVYVGKAAGGVQSVSQHLNSTRRAAEEDQAIRRYYSCQTTFHLKYLHMMLNICCRTTEAESIPEQLQSNRRGNYSRAHELID